MSAAAQSSVSLLIIDDNPSSLELLSEALAQPGLEIRTASDPEEGLDLFCDRRPHIVLTDLVMPKMSGMDVLERIMEIDSATDVILMTAHYSSESAVEAIRKGASDYLNKPVSLGILRERIGKLVEEPRKRQLSFQLEDELRTNSEFQGIMGRNPQMWEMFSRMRRVAPHYRALMITGETGTGKDLAARAIHNLSPVASGRYVVLNCSAVVETLFESELFGHVKGSFTGATQDKTGLFEHAHGGTLLLDEIGEICHSAPRRSSYGSCRTKRCNVWERCERIKSMCASLPPRITICAPPSPRGVFGRTSTTASLWWRFRCRG